MKAWREVLSLPGLGALAGPDWFRIGFWLLLLSAPYVMPLGLVAGFTTAFGQGQRDGELQAARLLGIGPVRLACPALLMAGLAAVMSFGLQVVWAPRAERSLERLVAQKLSETRLPTGQFIQRENSLFLAQAGSATRFEGVFYAELDENGALQHVITAQSGDINRQTSAAIEIDLDRGGLHFFDGSAPGPAAFFGESQLSVRKVIPASRPPPAVDELSLPEWVSLWQVAPEKRRELAWVLQEKITLAAATFSLGFLAIALASSARRDLYASLTLGIAATLGWFALWQTASWFAASPGWFAVWWLWLPNFLTLAAGSWLLLEIARPR